MDCVCYGVYASVFVYWHPPMGSVCVRSFTYHKRRTSVGRRRPHRVRRLNCNKINTSSSAYSHTKLGILLMALLLCSIVPRSFGTVCCSYIWLFIQTEQYICSIPKSGCYWNSPARSAHSVERFERSLCVCVCVCVFCTYGTCGECVLATTKVVLIFNGIVLSDIGLEKRIAYEIVPLRETLCSCWNDM